MGVVHRSVGILFCCPISPLSIQYTDRDAYTKNEAHVNGINLAVKLVLNLFVLLTVILLGLLCSSCPIQYLHGTHFNKL